MTQDWWRKAVVYQIYPRSFQDSTGDGSGDLKGITRRLDHVADLGVDAIWLSPIFTSPMADMGYDVTDHRGIDPLFGTLDDFDALVAEAHRLGLKVILDQVLSHASITHPFFAESRQSRDNARADWFVWADGKPDGTPPNNWQAIFGGPAWEWEPKRRQYYFHNFLTEQPDLNFHNPEVRAWAADTLRFWMERGVDGFRLDTANFYIHDAELRDNPLDTRDMPRPTLRSYDMQFPEFSKNRPEALDVMAELRAAVEPLGGVLIGEIGESHHPVERLADYTAPGRLHMGYHPEMMGAIFTAAHFRDQIERYYTLNPDGVPAWAFSNHDVPRHVSRWAEHAADPKSFAKLCAALLLSLPGSVCLYQGEELGLPVPPLSYGELVDPEGLRFWPENPGRDGARTPMPWEADAPNAGFSNADKTWLPVKPVHRELAVDRQVEGPASVLSFYRTLLAWRRNLPAIGGRQIEFLDLDEPLLGFRTDSLLCIFNLGRGEARVSILDELEVDHAQRAVIGEDRCRLGPNGFFLARVIA